MKQTAEYANDLYGLKTLDTAGGLFIHEVPDVPHNCWLFDYTSLATNLPCKHDPVYDAQIYPVLRSVETKFSDFTIVDMKDTAEYTKDLYGLKTLDTAGGLYIHEVSDVPHDCWLFDYTSLATNLPCKHDPVYDAQIYPLLV
ncbi:hypothetical protein PRIC2_000750 [Phytophthora ramorum]